MTERNDNQVDENTVIDMRQIVKSYDSDDRRIEALRGLDLMINKEDFVIIYGPSGCGKSTLLHIMTGADNPTTGEVTIRGRNIFRMNEDERGLYRSMKMGIVYQMPYWIKSLNVLENVALPLIIEGMREKYALRHAMTTLKKLDIQKFASQSPAQLSGGEQQKVGLARALVSDPLIIIADEPTGNMDSAASDEIMSLFRTLNLESKKTIVMVTHNQAYWDIGTRRIEMQDGRILREVNCG